MKTGTLTFHGSHNYGSMLQAYALQQTMISVFGDNEIINFRSRRQKRMMKVLTFRPRLGPILKDLTHILYYRSLRKKYRLFERFLNTELSLSLREIKEVKSEDLQDYELLCSGSDQIWNPAPEDFDFAYLLPYNFNGKKISYAASMGPGREIWPKDINDFPGFLKSFDAISVREEGTKYTVKNLTGREDIEVHCDPVLLLDKKKWLKLVDPKPLVNGSYIFLYTLFANSDIIECAKALSAKYRLPIVISNFTNLHDLLSPFKKELATGPKEFLNLMYNADMIITSSFHGTAFSILLNKPFVSINGLKDNRISNLLTLTGLEERSVSKVDEIQRVGWEIDFSKANSSIQNERRRSINYLSAFKK